MVIDPKLEKVMEITKEDVEIPILIEYSLPLDIEFLERLGFVFEDKSEFLPFIYGYASSLSIKQLVNVPNIIKIYYNEPIYAL